MEILRENYGVMIGIGCGKPIHSKLMPIDTAMYLSAADTIREQESCDKGALLLADIDVAEEIVVYREERLRKILEVLGIGEKWDLVKQSCIPSEYRNEVAISEGIPEEDQSYFKHEVQDAVILLRRAGLKVGWVLDEEAKSGGESYFDIEIARNRPDIRFAYNLCLDEKKKGPTMAGIPLRKDHGKRKPPYLVKNPETHLRICLPTSPAQLEQEMDKLARNEISEAGNQRVIDFCTLIEGSTTRNDQIDLRLRDSLQRFFVGSVAA